MNGFRPACLGRGSWGGFDRKMQGAGSLATKAAPRSWVKGSWDSQHGGRRPSGWTPGRLDTPGLPHSLSSTPNKGSEAEQRCVLLAPHERPSLDAGQRSPGQQVGLGGGLGLVPGHPRPGTGLCTSPFPAAGEKRGGDPGGRGGKGEQYLCPQPPLGFGVPQPAWGAREGATPPTGATCPAWTPAPSLRGRKEHFVQVQILCPPTSPHGAGQLLLNPSTDCVRCSWIRGGALKRPLRSRGCCTRPLPAPALPECRAPVRLPPKAGQPTCQGPLWGSPGLGSSQLTASRGAPRPHPAP